MGKFNIQYILLALTLVMTSVGSMATEKTKEIGFILEREGNFEVLHDRATSTATGAALFGLVGAAIESGVDSSNDSKKEAQLLERLPNANCNESLVGSLVQTLGKAKSLNFQMIESKDQVYDLLLNLKIDSCGFRIVNTVNYKLAAYVDVKMELTEQDAKKPILKEKLLIQGKKRMQFYELLADDDTLLAEFIRVQEKAGKRIANKIIYQ